jgi:GT2 family glycosyltransferase
MRSKQSLAASVEELKRELQAVRRHGERIQSALYDLQLNPPDAVSGREASYRQLLWRVRETVRTALPPEATVVVVSKGDPHLLDLYGREAWHFPQTTDGRYGGYYPKRGLSAIAHLEAVRARGGEYLLLPATALWWLDHYPEWRCHLERRYRRLVDDPETCLIYSLGERPERELAPLEQLIDELTALSGDEPAILDWGLPASLRAGLGDRNVFSPPVESVTLPYLDNSVDIVATRNSPERRAEAQRVTAVATALAGDVADGSNGGPSQPRVSVVRKAETAAARLPSLSIIVPCHDGLQFTKACLRTLVETLPEGFEGEILVVDDASSDGTADHLKAWSRGDKRARVLGNPANLGFLASCNHAAQDAKGDYLLFLNNDTVLLPGWLPPLLRTFQDFPDAGAVGARLLYPDGRLQEAGGIVFSDGSAWKIGYGDPDADAACYRHVRRVDYVSGALLLTPSRLFGEIGGLDPRYGFGFYDDDDYCFAVRASGRSVYYQPESVVVHFEGASSGMDVSVGVKRQQVTNQRLFVEKWADVLRGYPARPDGFDARALYGLMDRVRDEAQR